VLAAQNGIRGGYFHELPRAIPGRRIEAVRSRRATSAVLSPERAIGLRWCTRPRPSKPPGKFGI